MSNSEQTGQDPEGMILATSGGRVTVEPGWIVRQLRLEMRLSTTEERAMGSSRKPLAWDAVCADLSRTENLSDYQPNSTVFRQGQRADSVFHLRRGQVKLAVLSRYGREGIVALVDPGEFFGEGCLAGQRLRRATATALIKCTVGRIEKRVMKRLLRDRHDISERFVEHLLLRNMRYEADLVGQMFNSAEKRLARILLHLSHFGKECRTRPVVPRVSQADLARLVGTSSSRVSHLMNRFRTSGYLDYAGGGGVTVHKGLLDVVLCD